MTGSTNFEFEYIEDFAFRFVRLHLPFPVARIFFPTLGRASTAAIFSLAFVRFALIAAASPDAPAPTMIMS